MAAETDAAESSNICVRNVCSKVHNQKRGCEKRIVPKKERPRVYNELKVFLSVIINLQ